METGSERKEFVISTRVATVTRRIQTRASRTESQFAKKMRASANILNY